MIESTQVAPPGEQYADPVYREAALHVAELSADVANYCDHVEHNEPADVAWVTDSAVRLRSIAVALAAAESVDVVDIYADRLEHIERRNVHFCDGYLGWEHARQALTWRDLQLVQADHDRHYHPDVAGLTKAEQLRHYAFHVAKLAGLAAKRARTTPMRTETPATAAGSDLHQRLIADLLLFAIKLHTVMGRRMDDTPLPGCA